MTRPIAPFLSLRSAFCILVFTACTAAPPPAQTQAPFTPNATAQRVVLMSLDGLGADALAEHADLGAFARLAEGTRVRRVVPVEPSVTSTAHVSILTGARPERHGVVANRFHLPGTPRTQTAVGMDVESDVETLIEAAKRQGKRVGCVPFPTCDGRTPRRSADFGMVWTTASTRARMIRLSRADFKAEWVPPGWTARPQRRRSFSPIMRARIEWSVAQKLRTDVDLVAYDTTDDQTQNYDLLFVENGDDEIVPDAKGWFAFSRRADDGLYGSWSKILRYDSALEGVTLYWGAISRTNGYPETYRAMLDDQVGFWPGAPDENLASDWLAGRDGIEPDVFIEQLERFADFLTRAQKLTIQRMPVDLLLLYQPQIDEAAHQFMIELDSQKNATPANRAAGERVRRAAFVSADRALATLMYALDPAKDALVVTGDHGLGPIDTEVRMNRLLADRGFGHWSAFASGNVAQLHRFGGSDDTDALIAMLTGSGLFERVERKGATAHRNAGDVIAFANSNVALNGSENAPPVVKPDYYGQHGGLIVHPQYHATLFAWGAGVRKETVEQLPQTRIARYVATLLGIQPPAAAE